ncbi:MAG: UTP--glucose-1-phosphate uridylyltransferase [Planctomycetota bacterium]|nr:MAG: UTP--glucose-1-phosphate uridylyltransferase [Planctomycetota bacterium]REJ88836.1 MAG: UTP--glucose-1-phosphate uridylyltransferase [Planctomycetota bacterium]REK29460.1 MAG: UTP--glucose-1-phosphate uridylyltransferase [Planctomycetota bacterium]REK31825.1 MAG: UTP--glucose-1-phosphate uridylyltransferase [Planctomycetota bacterium]
MNIRRAVITAAGPGQATLPLQQIVDGTGRQTTALEMIITETLSGGVDDLCIVVSPGQEAAFRQAAGSQSDRLTFLPQSDPRGYGDALFRAREFVGDDHFLHLVGDHLYLSRSEDRCVKQLVEIAHAEKCAVSGVQPTRERYLPYFGVVGGTPVRNRPNLYEVQSVVEKPTPTQAEQELTVSGLRSGHYLCLFGIHVLPPTVMDLLGDAMQETQPGESIPLSPILSRLAGQERYLALEVDGVRYDIGVQYGLLIAQLAVALKGSDRDRVLTDLVELLATQT